MIAGLVLAAGTASRFGGDHKLLSQVPDGLGGEQPLVRAAVAALLASRLNDLVVVLGRDAARVRAALDGLPVRFALNEQFAAGMSGSLRIGVEEATGAERPPEALVVALGDQPLVGGSIVDALIQRFDRLAPAERSAFGGAIVAPRYAGERGNPVLFSASLRPELLEVTGDRGARSVVEREASRVFWVDFPFPPPVDVDVPNDLAALRRTLGA